MGIPVYTGPSSRRRTRRGRSGSSSSGNSSGNDRRRQRRDKSTDNEDGESSSGVEQNRAAFDGIGTGFGLGERTRERFTPVWMQRMAALDGGQSQPLRDRERQRRLASVSVSLERHNARRRRLFGAMSSSIAPDDHEDPGEETDNISYQIRALSEQRNHPRINLPSFSSSTSERTRQNASSPSLPPPPPPPLGLGQSFRVMLRNASQQDSFVSLFDTFLPPPSSNSGPSATADQPQTQQTPSDRLRDSVRTLLSRVADSMRESSPETTPPTTSASSRRDEFLESLRSIRTSLNTAAAGRASGSSANNASTGIPIPLQQTSNSPSSTSAIEESYINNPMLSVTERAMFAPSPSAELDGLTPNGDPLASDSELESGLGLVRRSEANQLRMEDLDEDTLQAVRRFRRSIVRRRRTMGASSHAGAGGTSSILDQQPRSLTEMISDRLSYRPYALLSSRVQSPSAAESNATSRGTGNLARAAQQAAERIRELSESMDRYPLGIFDSSMSSDWPPSGRSTSSALPPASAGPRPSTLGSISRLSGTDAASRPPPLRDFARLRERTSRLHAESAALLERSGAAALAFPPPPPALPSPPIFSGAHLDERAAGGAPRSPFVDPLNPAVYRPIYSGPAESAIDVDEDREDMIGRRGRTGASAISSLAGGTTHQPPPATAPQRPSTSTTTATHLNSTAMTLPPHLIATATPHQPRLADVIEEVLSRATTTSPPLPGYDASAESSSSFAPALGATFSPLVLPARSAAEPSISTPPSSSNPFTSFQAPAPRLPSQTSVPSAPAIQVTSQHTSLWSTLSDAANLALSLSPPLPAATHTGSNVSLGSTAVSLQPSPPLAATASPSLGQRRPPNFSPGFGPLRRVSSPRVIPGIGMGVPPPALPIGGAELPPAVVDPIGAGASSVGASVNSARARGERVSVTGLGRRLSSNK